MGAMAAVLFLDGAALLLAPWWVVVVLLVVWVALFVWCTRWWTPHPGRLPWVAAAALGLWFVVMLGGGIALGWGPAVG